MLKKIFDGAYLKRLDNIKQWQEMDVFKEESVSQHSYKVGIFCRVLLEDIFGFDNKDAKVLAFKLDCMDRAVFHDWDEALILRDMSHETKYNEYNGSRIREVLDDLSKHKAIQEFGEDDGNERGNWSASANMVIGNISGCPADTKKFVKLCDWLALIFYIKREQALGNKNLDFNENIAMAGFAEAMADVKEMLKRKFEGYDLNFREFDNFNFDKYE